VYWTLGSVQRVKMKCP